MLWSDLVDGRTDEQNVNAIRSCLEYLYGEALRANLPFTAKLIFAAAASLEEPGETRVGRPGQLN